MTEFNSPPNRVRDKGIYSPRAGSILTSAGPAWDLRVQLLWNTKVRINECRSGNWRVEEMAYSILPIEALCKKATV